MATSLLQRARLADPFEGPWEAADVQWWSVRPRASDDVERLFWLDDGGPVAGVLLTSWSNGTWQCDPVSVPRTAGAGREELWHRALEHASQVGATRVEVPVDAADSDFQRLATSSGMRAVRHDSTGIVAATDVPAAVPMPGGFELVDRTRLQAAPHPMRHRNGADVAQRLSGCSLYDPWLDIAVETRGGREAGYSLYWYDPVTKVGLVEPMRVEDEFQRRGLARAMILEGMNRLVQRGATRLKVSWESDAAGALYTGVGFEQTTTTGWYAFP